MNAYESTGVLDNPPEPFCEDGEGAWTETEDGLLWTAYRMPTALIAASKHSNLLDLSWEAQ